MSVAPIDETAQYLTFTLSREVFAVEVTRVREILEYTRVTRIPKSPDFMSGVINVRGSVVPVLDLRLKFMMGATEQSVDTCIIVLEVGTEEETVILGVLADSVQEVIELEPQEIEPPPKVGLLLRTDFMKGIGKRNGEFVMILDTDRVFSFAELSEVVEESTRHGMEEAV